MLVATHRSISKAMVAPALRILESMDRPMGSCLAPFEHDQGDNYLSQVFCGATSVRESDVAKGLDSG